MTDRIFNGGSADWFAASSWTPDGVPAPGDVLTVATGTVAISALDMLNVGTLDGEVLQFGAAAGDFAELTGTGVTFGSGFALVSSGTQAFSVMELAGTSVVYGTMLFDVAGGD
ncbi:MAG: hypothetical protein J0H57_05470, partial [Rhodospirillales bacterium]|nr:hypothetical protein [Rhodospirillales bacterium]